MKSGKNEDVLRKNDENNRACIHGDKEGEHAYEDTSEGQPTVASARNAGFI
jgi:hypothetical protein